MSKKDKHIVWFGMKVSPEEKAKIKKLASYMGVSQKEAVMSLVEDRITDYNARPGAGGPFKNVIEQFSGIMDGPEDLSANKEHLQGYGG